MRTEQIKDALDLLGGFEQMATIEEKKQTLLTVIDTLGGYPKPTKKHTTEPTTAHELGAYLFVSNCRNACKLGELECIAMETAHRIAVVNLGNALGLLLG